jgi:hypothetical protein
VSGSGRCDSTDSGICATATPRQCGNASGGHVLNTLRFASRMPRPYDRKGIFNRIAAKDGPATRRRQPPIDGLENAGFVCDGEAEIIGGVP